MKLILFKGVIPGWENQFDSEASAEVVLIISYIKKKKKIIWAAVETV